MKIKTMRTKVKTKTKTIGLLLLGCCMAFNSAQSLSQESKKIAVTIDDLPFTASTNKSLEEKTELTKKLLASLKKHNIEAVGFVNEEKLLVEGEADGHIAILKQWLEADMELGNHTFDHSGMHQTSLQDMKESVIKGRVVSEWLSEKYNKPYRYFRHPFTQTGNSVEEKAEFESFLKKQGLEVAPFTIEHTDYLFSCAYDRARLSVKKRASEDIAQIKQDYLQHLSDALDAFQTMSDELFARQVPQIWLIHANSINAETMDQQLELLKARGYEFITLEQAMQAPAYQIETAPSKRYGPSWLMRWAKQLKKELSVYGQPEPPEGVMAVYKELCQ
ncbi:polysaccharide deacetylase family protein [Kangiella koreensis]|uniref:Polysaccharide deacetylase n=1 Tax=Kangiella koreensis (strain DSM 16069 / JCM 12317 / KCTC 12182 / SW-125) TaxID=523791 RepID=C7R7Q9_KANKD|nr:polysaccharide deacetylase family protein [Kangiella koreensis]ACV27592.1 polysaccharide deacetylase [Kangiella koreensis DSM 16069]